MAKLYFKPDGSLASYNERSVTPDIADLTSVDFDPSTNQALLSVANQGFSRVSYRDGQILHDGTTLPIAAPSAQYSILSGALALLPVLSAAVQSGAAESPLTPQQTLLLQLAGVLAIDAVLGAM